MERPQFFSNDRISSIKKLLEFAFFVKQKNIFHAKNGLLTLILTRTHTHLHTLTHTRIYELLFSALKHRFIQIRASSCWYENNISLGT